jgi:hypothetical protein
MNLVRMLCSVAFLVFFCLRAAAQECTPPCRSGYSCRQGTCVSQCNPPCEPGYRCDTTQRDCVPVQNVNGPANTGNRADAAGTGGGKGAGITGLALSPVVLGLSIGSTVSRAASDGVAPALPLGVASIVVGDIVAPIAAAGGASSRHSGARGVLALRLVGWIAYGLSNAVLAAMVGIGLGTDAPPPPAVILVDGVLATVGSVMLSADALASGSQANRRDRAECRDRPSWYLSLGATRTGALRGSVTCAF